MTQEEQLKTALELLDECQRISGRLQDASRKQIEDNLELVKALKEGHTFLKSLLDAQPDEATDFITNNGEEVEEVLRGALERAGETK